MSDLVKKCHIFENTNKDHITYFLVVVRLPFMMRVEVETDLKLPIPPPMLSIPSRPPKEEKEVNSTGKKKQKTDDQEDNTTPVWYCKVNTKCECKSHSKVSQYYNVKIKQ